MTSISQRAVYSITVFVSFPEGTDQEQNSGRSAADQIRRTTGQGEPVANPALLHEQSLFSVPFCCLFVFFLFYTKRLSLLVQLASSRTSREYVGATESGDYLFHCGQSVDNTRFDCFTHRRFG